MNSCEQALIAHQRALRKCKRCPNIQGPVVTGQPVRSPVLLVGQAPGSREIVDRRPFAWTAGKTLFGWFADNGLDENAFRHLVYMAAVCRCFPGKNIKGGDRVPDRVEIENCAGWLRTELQLLRPRLVLPVGKLAISRFLPVKKLAEVVGVEHRRRLYGFDTDIIPLPHPSGASTWHRTQPGKALLGEALRKISAHPAWREICSSIGQPGTSR